jgi:amino acid adenylation domain-containing protein
VISLLQDYVTAAAKTRADETAVVMGDERLTYGELDEASNRLGRLLRDFGLERGDRVCLFLPKSPVALTGMLGVLKAGCAYVPIDIASPAPRVQMIIEASEPKMVLASGLAATLLEQLAGGGSFDASIPIGSVDPDGLGETGVRAQLTVEDWNRYPGDPISSQGASPQDAAHILFTSGSTGVPKGVVITHANVIAFVEWARRYFGMSASDRVSQHAPLHFDLSTFDIYGTFSAGAALYLVPPAVNLLPASLAEFIRSSELTQWFSVPSVLTHMARSDAIRENDFPALRRLLWCGEVLPTPILIHWMRRLGHVQFTNLYGPTEATIASSYHTVAECPDNPTEPIPIGVACEGEELLVLDEKLRPAPPGEVGDIYIGGAGLSPGYWRDEEKTRAAFLPDPRSTDPKARIYRTGDLGSVSANGLVSFLGRADSQIKSRGYRIELGEIESALNALDKIAECAVVGVESEGFEGTAICCAYAGRSGTTIEPRELRMGLREVLPSYMLPSRWMAFEKLPKNVNGKIDRRQLKELFASNGKASHV